VPFASQATSAPEEIRSQPVRPESPPEEQGSCTLFYPGDDPEQADFFAPAPEEIGPLRSAHTSLLKKIQPKSALRRFLIGVLIGVGVSAVSAIVLYFSARLDGNASAVVFVMFCLVISPFTLILTWYFTRFHHFNGYVGTRGIAHFTCKGSRQNVKAREVFLFPTAQDLRVQTTHHYHNGAYTGTMYRYAWSNEAGKAVYVLSGKHNSKDKLPPPQDKYRFALAAEVGWSAYLLASILPQIEAGETYVFRLQKQNNIKVSNDSLELEIKKKVQRFTFEQLAEVKVKDGKVMLKEEGAREGWFQSEGVHSFAYSDLGNARLFLLLMEQGFGIPITE
jgi:hypothetical protein